MATRFYLPDSGTAPGTPNPSALWTLNPSIVRAPLSRTKTGTALADESSSTYVETSATTGNMLHRQFLSEPLPFAMTIGGTGNTFRLVVRGAENDAAADCSLQVHIRVLSGDMTTSRGNLYSGQSATLNTTIGALAQEFSTTQTTRVFNNITLSAISAQAGDRLCVEIGHRYHNTSTTSYGTYLTFGDPVGGTDHTFVATETAQLTPWIEFSQDLFRVTATRAVSWDTLAAVATTRVLSWAVAAGVTATRDVSWNVAAAVTATRDVSWDVEDPPAPPPALTQVTATRAVSWNVDGRVQATRAVSWDLAGRVTATRAISWDTLLRVSRFRDVSWNVAAILVGVATSRTVSWDVDVLPPPPVDRPVYTAAAAPRPSFATGYVVIVRNQALQRIGAISVKELSFTSRYNDVGEWALTVSAEDRNAAALFAPDAGVLIYHSDDMTTPLMTGPVLDRTFTQTEAGLEVQAAGADDMVYLRRLTYQMPGRDATAQNEPITGAHSHDVRSGPAEYVIKGFVEANVGQTALVGRRRLTVTPAGGSPAGANVVGKGRMLPTLLELIRGLAATGRIGFTVKQVGTILRFDTFVPRDRTGTARFGPAFNNVTEFSYNEKAPSASYVVAGASGLMVDRTFQAQLDGEALTKWPSCRFEQFIDQRQTINADELTQAMSEALISGGPTVSVSVATRDTPQIKFGITHFVGDKVTVDLGTFAGRTLLIKDVIQEATLTWSPGGPPTVVTHVGSYEITGTDAVRRRLRQVTKAITDVNTVD